MTAGNSDRSPIRIVNVGPLAFELAANVRGSYLLQMHGRVNVISFVAILLLVLLHAAIRPHLAPSETFQRYLDGIFAIPGLLLVGLYISSLLTWILLGFLGIFVPQRYSIMRWLGLISVFAVAALPPVLVYWLWNAASSDPTFPRTEGPTWSFITLISFWWIVTVSLIYRRSARDLYGSLRSRPKDAERTIAYLRMQIGEAQQSKRSSGELRPQNASLAAVQAARARIFDLISKSTDPFLMLRVLVWLSFVPLVLSIFDLIWICSDYELCTRLKSALSYDYWQEAHKLFLIFLIISPAAVFVSKRFSRRADRWRQPQAISLLEVDARAPVLLLRSFTDEHALVEALTNVGGFGNSARIEELVVDDLSRVGPVIAIGDPREHVPSSGAARQYLSEESWRCAATDWIEKASLIIVVAGTTPGLSWEIRRIQDLNAVSKVVWVMLRANSAQRVRVLLEAMATTVWGQALSSDALGKALAFYLNADGSAAAYHSEGVDGTDYQVAVVQAMHDMLSR
jgi:hypothetical protein